LFFSNFSRPETNSGGMGDHHLLIREEVDGSVSDILKNSCFDCHSDQTNYPWYDKIAPASWLVAHHIREGKKQLNFSNWGTLDLTDKITHLIEIQDEVKSGNMPIRSYTMMHRKARLSEEKSLKLISWAEKTVERLMNTGNGQ